MDLSAGYNQTGEKWEFKEKVERRNREGRNQGGKKSEEWKSKWKEVREKKGGREERSANRRGKWEK